MDFVDVEDGERNLILHDGQIGAVFRSEPIRLERAQAVAESFVEAALAVESRGPNIVQHVVQLLTLGFVKSGARRRGGGGKQRRIFQVIRKGAEPPRGN